jgi:hypothetical protein
MIFLNVDLIACCNEEENLVNIWIFCSSATVVVHSLQLHALLFLETEIQILRIETHIDINLIKSHFSCCRSVGNACVRTLDNCS